MAQLPPLVSGHPNDDINYDDPSLPQLPLPMPQLFPQDQDDHTSDSQPEAAAPLLPTATDQDDGNAPAKRRKIVVNCPFCFSTHCVLKSGSTRGVTYAYQCNSCRQVWTQLREPDASGDLRIRLSKRAVDGQPRRSGGYKCGVCGLKKKPTPGEKHVCPGYRVSDPGNANDDDTLQPLMSVIQADAQAALEASSVAIKAFKSDLPLESALNDDDVELSGVDAMATPTSKPLPIVATPVKPSSTPVLTVDAAPPTPVRTGTDLFKLLKLVLHKVLRRWQLLGLCNHGLCRSL